MTGEIIQIKYNWLSKNGNRFVVVIIRCDDGIYRKTFLVKDYRNYARWEKVLKKGNVLVGLVLKNEQMIDGDSPIRLLGQSISDYTEEDVLKVALS